MTGRRGWLTFERHGGLPPRDDESLEIGEDGTFTARRTIAGSSVGSFAGALPAAATGKLRRAVAAVAGAEDVLIETPAHGATERVVAGGRTLELGSSATAPKPWRALSTQLRSVLQGDVVAQPRAAIRLVADLATARLEHAGSAPLDVDLGSLETRVVLMDADDVPAERWSRRTTEEPAWVTAGPGWRLELPFDHGFRPAAGAWLQVRVEVMVRQGGVRRAARMYVPVHTDG